MTSHHVHTETADLRGPREGDSQMYPYMHRTRVQNIWLDLSKKEKQSEEEKLKFIIYQTGYRSEEDLWSYFKAIYLRQTEKHNHLYKDMFEKLWIESKQTLSPLKTGWPWINFLALVNIRWISTMWLGNVAYGPSCTITWQGAVVQGFSECSDS